MFALNELRYAKLSKMIIWYMNIKTAVRLELRIHY